MTDTRITICGNAVGAELRFSPSGKPVCSFRIASTPRRLNRQSNEWEDGETLWLNASLWGQAAENLIETIGDAKSLAVIVQGRLKQRSFETKEGEKRTVIELDVDEIGPSLRYATARVQKTSRQQGGGGWSQPQQQPPASDPWGRGSMNDTQPPPF